MVWLSRLFAGQEAANARLTASQQLRISAWRQLPAAAMTRSHYRSRYVVVDVEIAGGDWQTDPLGAIGAVAVVDGLIAFQDALQVVVATPTPASAADQSTSRQGLTRQDGVEQGADSLLDFLDFVGKAPLVAYHASFAARRIERAIAEALGVDSRLPWIDLAWVMASLFRDAGDARTRMDVWLAHFGVESGERHNAVFDAYATAKLLQVSMARAARKGFETPASLVELEKAHRHLYQSA